MQIHVPRHVQGRFGLLGQVISLQNDVNNLARQILRTLKAKYFINLNIGSSLIQEPSYIVGALRKSVVRRNINNPFNPLRLESFNMNGDIASDITVVEYSVVNFKLMLPASTFTLAIKITK